MASISTEKPYPFRRQNRRRPGSLYDRYFEENAMDLVQNAYNQFDHTCRIVYTKVRSDSKQSASEKAREYGITSFQDAGSSIRELRFIEKACKERLIHQRIYAMLYEQPDSLSNKNLSFCLSAQPDRFKCAAVKMYMDGAQVHTAPGWWSPTAISPRFWGKILSILRSSTSCKPGKGKINNCAHAIGDRGNKKYWMWWNRFYSRVLASGPKMADWTRPASSQRGYSPVEVTCVVAFHAATLYKWCAVCD